MDKKGKSMNTSVPSIAIRFHTNDEELEQLYVSDSELEKESNTSLPDIADDLLKDDLQKAKKEFSPKRESSPMKDVFTKLSKRSSSVDSNIALGEQSPSGGGDRWRLFSEIRGKLTKTVEEKISEMKSGSKSSDHEKEDAETIRGKFHASKENSSVSDSEDVSISENSTSKFADVEMSSTNGTEDETESQSNKASGTNDTIVHDLDEQLFNDEIIIKMPRLENVRHRFKKSSAASGINVQYKSRESTPPLNRDSFIETATEALEDDDDISQKPLPQLTEEKNKLKTQIPKWFYMCTVIAIISIILSLVALPNYLTGFFTGLFVLIITQSFQSSDQNSKLQNFIKQKIEILNRGQLSIKTYEPSVECEGWMNEYPGKYDVNSYHIGATHSVFVRLKDSKLILSSGDGIRVPKRSMWNEAAMPHWKLIQFNHHRVFDMKEAKVKLLPEGLARKRYWSKKYPICLEFKKMPKVLDKLASEDDKLIEENIESQVTRSPKKVVDSEKVTSDNTNELPEETDVKQTAEILEVDTKVTSRKTSVDDNDLDISDDVDENSIEWDTIEDVIDDIIQVYVFARTDRDKEEWFNNFVKATLCDIQESIDLEQVKESASAEDNQSTKSSPSHKNSVKNEETKKKNVDYLVEYQNFMKKMQVRKKSDDTAPEQTVNEISSKVLWLNAVLGRVLFDAIRQEFWVDVLQQRIQRKLSVIKLPYFIEELVISELNLGTAVPVIHKVSEPIFDSRGIWVDFDITYEGSLYGTLETKLNLMKLKKPPIIVAQEVDVEKLSENTLPGPVYDSDLDDSAESSSEEDLSVPVNWISNPSNTSTQTASPNSSSNTTGKKLLKMVDKIAASKYFQQATDYKLIKKAMEGVSRTELKLRVELKGLVGVLTINIPPPPTHRIWIGFRGNPQLWLNAKPIVGERSLNINQITSWIENKLQQEFQKILVLPNMEDFVIPIMNQNLPE